MMQEWAYWIVGGILLMLAELAFGSFFILWFGLAAVVVGIVALVAPSLPLAAEIALWTAISIALVVLWFKYLKPGNLKTRIGTASEQFIGEIGIVTREIKPFQKGMVQFQKPILGDDKWDALADADLAIGERVKVVSVEGNMLKVSAA
jgi:inner membrane protein